MFVPYSSLSRERGTLVTYVEFEYGILTIFQPSSAVSRQPKTHPIMPVVAISS